MTRYFGKSWDVAVPNRVQLGILPEPLPPMFPPWPLLPGPPFLSGLCKNRLKFDDDRLVSLRAGAYRLLADWVD